MLRVTRRITMHHPPRESFIPVIDPTFDPGSQLDGPVMTGVGCWDDYDVSYYGDRGRKPAAEYYDTACDAVVATLPEHLQGNGGLVQSIVDGTRIMSLDSLDG